MKARVVNIYRSGPPPEYAEDLEEDETLSRFARLNMSKETDSL